MTNSGTKIAFILIDDFALISYASVMEPFRAANNMTGANLYIFTHMTIDGRPAVASNGALVPADMAAGAFIACDILIVVAGGSPTWKANPAISAALRRAAASGARLIGVSGGAFFLAHAGLVRGRRATVHWDYQTQFARLFPDVLLEQSLYVADTRILTCAGGAAGLDLAVQLIGQAHGEDLATRVGEWYIQSEPRDATLPQRKSISKTVSTFRVSAAIAHMEDNLAAPLSREELARRSGTSARQLDRLFAQHTSQSASGYYLNLRLDTARTLLRLYTKSIGDVAHACGFASDSHFSRCFKRRFGYPPSRRL